MDIKAKVVQYSTGLCNKPIITIEAEYPRFIHSELMTHRVFSRNAASSRAIPIDKMMAQVFHDPAMPVEWGINQAGMQAGSVHESSATCVWAWKTAARSAVKSAQVLRDLGLHKQLVNRLLEPFQTMKTIITATEWENFFELRMHKDAQPEIQQLATKIHEAIENSEPMVLGMGEWHVPYVSRYRCPEYENIFYYLGDEDQTDLTLEEAKKVSASCCAQVSYRVLDDTLEKAEMIYDRLVNAKPIHASPFEHQATLLNSVTDRSGNFQGWLQNREILET